MEQISRGGGGATYKRFILKLVEKHVKKAAELQVQAVLKLMIFPGFENDGQAVIIKMTFLTVQTYSTIKKNQS